MLYATVRFGKKFSRSIAKRPSNRYCNELMVWEFHLLPGRWRNDIRNVTWNSGGADPTAPPRTRAPPSRPGVVGASAKLQDCFTSRGPVACVRPPIRFASDRRVRFLGVI